MTRRCTFCMFAWDLRSRSCLGIDNICHVLGLKVLGLIGAIILASQEFSSSRDCSCDSCVVSAVAMLMSVLPLQLQLERFAWMSEPRLFYGRADRVMFFKFAQPAPHLTISQSRTRLHHA